MINSHRLGIVLGGFLVLVHIIWIVLVAMGVAGPLIAFVHRINFVEVSFAMGEFGFGNSIMLLIVNAVLGYLAGQVLGGLWNFVSTETKEDYVVDKGY